MIKWTPKLLKLALNVYGPFLGAGVRVRHIRSDWRELHVEMKLRWYNRNALGSHFGGSLYSMVDPHLALLLMQLLGKRYIVWDKAARIEFVSPGRGLVRSLVQITDEQVAVIREEARANKAAYPEFELEVLGEDGSLVAKVHKTLYVRERAEV